MKLSWMLFLIFASYVVGMSQVPDVIFKSGYEGTTQVIQYNLNGSANPDYAEITGSDNGFDWVIDLDDNNTIGDFRIFYESGDTSKSRASLAPDPLNPLNTTLKFQIKKPHIEYIGNTGDILHKGRIQAALHGNPLLTEFVVKQKIYLHPDLQMLSGTPQPIGWLTIQEFWNNESNHSFPFRITVNIQKLQGTGAPLMFGVHGQTKISQGNWFSIWEVADTNHPLPVGQWITLETYLKEGDSLNGRFRVTVTDSAGTSWPVADITGFTHHPDDPNPDGVTSFNPMKLYTSGELINGMDSINACLCLYWDDFQFWTDSLSTGSMVKTHTPVRVFPNPANHFIRIESIKKIDFIEMYSSSGKLIRREAGGFNKTIQTTGWPAGIYFLLFAFDGQQFHSLPIVIQ